MNKYDKNGYCLMDEIGALAALIGVIALVIGVLALDLKILEWLHLLSDSKFDNFMWLMIINAFPFVLIVGIGTIYEKIRDRNH